MVDETPIAMPRNYKSFWAAEWSEWITQENFILWFGEKIINNSNPKKNK